MSSGRAGGDSRPFAGVAGVPVVVVGTVGTGKSYSINAIRQLFTDRAAASTLKSTVLTRVAAKIRGSSFFLLLSLLSHTLTGEHLLCI